MSTSLQQEIENTEKQLQVLKDKLEVEKKKETFVPKFIKDDELTHIMGGKYIALANSYNLAGTEYVDVKVTEEIFGVPKGVVYTRQIASSFKKLKKAFVPKFRKGNVLRWKYDIKLKYIAFNDSYLDNSVEKIWVISCQNSSSYNLEVYNFEFVSEKEFKPKFFKGDLLECGEGGLKYLATSDSYLDESGCYDGFIDVIGVGHKADFKRQDDSQFSKIAFEPKLQSGDWVIFTSDGYKPLPCITKSFLDSNDGLEYVWLQNVTGAQPLKNLKKLVPTDIV